MGGYIANFTVYTMAMTGLICFAVIIYKKIMDGSFRNNSSKFLSIEETMSLTPRKTLHVVRAGNEKFLIASDIDRTTLISRLEDVRMQQRTKDFERFRNIEQEIPAQEIVTQPQDYDFQTNEIQVQEQAPKQETAQAPKNQKTVVHLEPITKKQTANPPLRKNMDKREPQKLVTLDFEKLQNHGFSTMKEMAKKINEL